LLLREKAEKDVSGFAAAAAKKKPGSKRTGLSTF
jgi:hypothetical protein